MFRRGNYSNGGGDSTMKKGTTMMRLFTTSQFYMFFPPTTKVTADGRMIGAEADDLSTSVGSISFTSGSDSHQNNAGGVDGRGDGAARNNNHGSQQPYAKDIIVEQRSSSVSSISVETAGRPRVL